MGDMVCQNWPSSNLEHRHNAWSGSACSEHKQLTTALGMQELGRVAWLNTGPRHRHGSLTVHATTWDVYTIAVIANPCASTHSTCKGSSCPYLHNAIPSSGSSHVQLCRRQHIYPRLTTRLAVAPPYTHTDSYHVCICFEEWTWQIFTISHVSEDSW